MLSVLHSVANKSFVLNVLMLSFIMLSGASSCHDRQNQIRLARTKRSSLLHAQILPSFANSVWVMSVFNKLL